MTPRKQPLLPGLKTTPLTHGGGTSLAHAKHQRPLDRNKWIHLILKSERAKGDWSLLRHKLFIQALVSEKGKRFGVRIGDFANVGNHLHLKIKIQSREGFQSFLKSVTTMIARKVTGAKKGHPVGRFWQGLAFTRVLKSSLEVLRLKGYFEGNRIEARSGYRNREMYLDLFNDWVKRLGSS